MIYSNINEFIGKTPLIRLNKIVDENSAEVLVKVEAFNPGGSVKSRAALFMIDEAERSGLLKKGGTIIEATSGNTGISLAMIGAARGYKVIIAMPESMSIERRRLMEGYGAELILTPASLGMAGSVEIATKLAEEKGYFLARQFENENNVKAHYETTSLELIEDTNGKIDAFVAGVGTGGTITGIGKRLKEKLDGVQIIAVEPKSSPLLTEGKAASHKIQGIGANFVPKILDLNFVDEIKTVSNEDAFEAARELGKKEGILVGISSGAALHAGLIKAKELGIGKRVVVLLPDTGERYLSTELFI